MSYCRPLRVGRRQRRCGAARLPLAQARGARGCRWRTLCMSSCAARTMGSSARGTRRRCSALRGRSNRCSSRSSSCSCRGGCRPTGSASSSSGRSGGRSSGSARCRRARPTAGPRHSWWEMRWSCSTRAAGGTWSSWRCRRPVRPPRTGCATRRSASATRHRSSGFGRCGSGLAARGRTGTRCTTLHCRRPTRWASPHGGCCTTIPMCPPMRPPRPP